MPAKKQTYQVLLTQGAEHDLESIIDYIAQFDSAEKANYVLDHLSKAAATLAQFPERGSIPIELRKLGIREYRQIMFKPYRVIYRQIDRQVVISVIADGRRDMQSLLVRRLLGS